MEVQFCCCKSGNTDDNCCGPYLGGQAIPDTPERLMRSRYAAFFHGNIDYLIATSDPDNRQANDRQMLADTCKHTQWLGLEIIKTDDSQLDQGNGFVEFVAFYERKEMGQLHENSRFVYKEGRWYYCDGQILAPVVWGRNQPCWCKSGKKYKKCHGKS
ncbi:MAG: YchJ family protein [Desulfobacteraceae bacterium]|nr:YchJ family protein [Desulfobacteraceae bacterium]